MDMDVVIMNFGIDIREFIDAMVEQSLSFLLGMDHNGFSSKKMRRTSSYIFLSRSKLRSYCDRYFNQIFKLLP